MKTESLRDMVDALRASGMTYTEIGKLTGANRTSVMRWREGLQRPTGEHLFALLTAAEEQIAQWRAACKINR